MNIFRSYFDKNNTLIKDSELNSAKNQVTEIAYGGKKGVFSAFIFKPNLENLTTIITNKELTLDQLNSANTHVLNLKNTINLSTTKLTHLQQERAYSFELILFKLTEDWDEGNGYEIILDKTTANTNSLTKASNWFNRKADESWENIGAFNINNYEIIDTIGFDNGDEDFNVDVTTYINDIIYSGSVNYGLGIAFNPIKYFEVRTDRIQSVNFHTKYTNTYFEPFIETSFNNHILDDRNCFHLNTDNKLYFFAKRGMEFYNVQMKYVNIYDNNNELILRYDETKIKKNSRGVYYIDINLDDETYIDSSLFRDEWVFEMYNTEKRIMNSFFIMNGNYNQDLTNNLVSVKIFGIYNNQIFKRGEKITIDFNFNSLYESLINYCSYNFNYDLYVKYGKNIVYLIRDGIVNKVPNKYFITLNSEFLIQNTYYLDINLKYNDQMINNTNINFKIV